MKLSIKGLAFACGVGWGGSVLLLGILNLIWPSYGVAMLDLARSLYPGYTDAGGFGGVLVGTLYALVDGAIAGAIFAWLYNVARPASVDAKAVVL
jgi:hypothetical protein